MLAELEARGCLRMRVWECCVSVSWFWFTQRQHFELRNKFHVCTFVYIQGRK